MDDSAVRFDQFRASIIAEPEAILDDREVMRALIAANGDTLGQNVVDLRGIALDRMEDRLARLEDTHRSVIAAAYDNLAGTNQVHRATLRILDATEFPEFLQILSHDIAAILNVDTLRLVLETVHDDQTQPLQDRFDGLLAIRPGGFVAAYLGPRHERQVLLRQIVGQIDGIYGPDASWLRSEACLRLDFGRGRLPGLLALATEDPHKFKPAQGTDLLTFFGGVFERAMRRWLA